MSKSVYNSYRFSYLIEHVYAVVIITNFCPSRLIGCFVIYFFRSLFLMAVIVGMSYYLDHGQSITIQPVVVPAADTLLKLSWPLQGSYKHTHTHIMILLDEKKGRFLLRYSHERHILSDTNGDFSSFLCSCKIVLLSQISLLSRRGFKTNKKYINLLAKLSTVNLCKTLFRRKIIWTQFFRIGFVVSNIR